MTACKCKSHARIVCGTVPFIIVCMLFIRRLLFFDTRCQERKENKKVVGVLPSTVLPSTSPVLPSTGLTCITQGFLAALSIMWKWSSIYCSLVARRFIRKWSCCYRVLLAWLLIWVFLQHVHSDLKFFHSSRTQPILPFRWYSFSTELE